MLQAFEVAGLFASFDPSLSVEYETARRYAPIIQFDAQEPFLPLAAGYTVFTEDGASPSFPRQIELKPAGQLPAKTAIEYAIWWDWDIQHLYELEHIWVHVNEQGQVIRGEASWHGGMHDMALNGNLPLTGDRLTLFSEAGKHAFAPVQDWLILRQAVTVACCTSEAGEDGLCTPPVIEGYIHSTPSDDQRIRAYLKQRAFIPAMQFTKVFDTLGDCLIPWPQLFAWVPIRIGWWMTELQRFDKSS